jgi:streptogramin lyase
MYTHYRHDPNDPSSLSSNIVRFVYEDRSGIFWVGTHGGGLNRFDRKTGTFKAYRNIPGDPRSISHDELRSILEDSDGVLWIGTNGGGLNRFDRRSETFTRYRSDPRDPSSLSNDYVRFIYEDSDKDFWLGTQGGGLNKLDRATGEFTHYMTDPSDPHSISSDYVFSMLEDESGLFWLGTWGGGLNTFDKAAGHFSFYTERDGLPSNSVYGALMSDDGELWVSTNNGLSRFDLRTETFKNYNEDDGLQENEFNGNSFYKSESGEMFFGGVNGFNAFYSEKIKDNPHAPPVVITSFSKLNREITFDRPMEELDKLVLSYRDYVFAFEFAALDYSAPSKNLYAYQMEGLDEDWVYTSSEKRFATYTTLPPGKYVFRVKGSNNDGVWNEDGVAVKLQITPPFHATWWFRTFIILVIIFLVYSWQKRRTKSVRMLAELQAAHDAQMSIMPQAPPRVESLDIAGICIPANEVGGDFFDYIYTCDDPNKLGIVIGDVSGKAMKAAMVAVMSSGMIFSKTSESCSIHNTMTQLNRSLYFKTEEIVYTALCLASLDVDSRKLTYSLAGLNPPLLKSNGKVTELGGVGPRFPLGMIRDIVYEEKEIQLKRSDVLVFYTDGLNESRNAAGDFYGSKILVDLIEKMDTSGMTAREIKATIVNDVKRFRGSETQQDDMTVIVIKLI